MFTKEKKPLLFLHGYLADGNSFYYQKPFFERYYKCYYPDFKGFGQNKGMEYPYSLDDYIKDVKEYLDKNNLKKVSVVAHSFGARVAVKMAAQGNVFDKIIITGGAGLKPRRNLKYHLKTTAFNLLKRFVKREKLKKFYSKDYLMLDSVMKKSFKKIVAENLDGYLSKIKNKTLIIYGKKDKETPLYMAKRFNKGIIGSRLVVIKDAGHFAFIDKPKEFNEIVLNFLEDKN